MSDELLLAKWMRCDIFDMIICHQLQVDAVLYALQAWYIHMAVVFGQGTTNSSVQSNTNFLMNKLHQIESVKFSSCQYLGKRALLWVEKDPHFLQT